MKLGFLLFDYFPYGGLQRDCLQVSQACAARGHEVTILTRTWQGDRPAAIGVELFERRGITNVARNRHWVRQLQHQLPQRGLDGVIGFNRLPGLDVYFGSDPCYVAKVARLKPFWYRWTPRYWHYRNLEAAVYRQGSPTQVLLLTPHEIPLYQHFYGTERERFHLLPPGIVRRTETAAERQAIRERVRSTWGCGREDRLLLFVGSGFRIKGLDRVLRGLASLSEERRRRTQLLVIGQNPPGGFAWLARQLGVAGAVRFLGGRSDVPDFMLGADVLVLPSRSESAGIVLVEALAAGLPVLTTNTCGYAFHVEGAGAGIVMPSPFDQSCFNVELERMLAASRPSDWSANGLAYAAREDLYSCHQQAAEYICNHVAQKTVSSR